MPNEALIVFEEFQVEPVPADPRHTRQVPTRTLPVAAGSSSAGASSSATSLLTCAAPMVAGDAKLAAAHADPAVHCFRFTPAPMVRNQLEGVFGSSSGIPPSPAASCGQGASDVAVEVPPEPSSPMPASTTSGVVGSCAKPVISASEPPAAIAVFRLSKWLLSFAEQAAPVCATPSVERQRPPSLPRNTSGLPLPNGIPASAC